MFGFKPTTHKTKLLPQHLGTALLACHSATLTGPVPTSLSLACVGLLAGGGVVAAYDMDCLLELSLEDGNRFRARFQATPCGVSMHAVKQIGP